MGPPALLYLENRNRLLDLGFLVDDVLANHRIVFLDFHLIRHISLVLVGSVEMPCSST